MARTAFTLPATCGDEPAKSTCDRRRLGIDPQPHRNPDRLVGHAVVVQPVFRAELARGHRAQLGAHQPLGVIEQLVDPARAALPCHTSPPVRRMRCSPTRQAPICASRSPSRSSRCAHVQQNQVEHLAIDLSAAHNPHRRNANALLKNLVRRSHRSRKPAAHIGVMRAIGNVKRRRACRRAETPAAPS